MRTDAYDPLAMRVIEGSTALAQLCEPWKPWFSRAITELALVIGNAPDSITYSAADVRRENEGYDVVARVWTDVLRVTIRATVRGDTETHATSVVRRGGAVEVRPEATRGVLDNTPRYTDDPGDVGVVVTYRSGEVVRLSAEEDDPHRRDRLVAFLPSLVAELEP